jgi:hypothetical protein
MANKKIIKPVSKTIEMGTASALITEVFGNADNPTPKSEIQERIDKMPIDKKVSLYAALGAYAEAINERFKAVENSLRSNSPTSVQEAYGDPEANVEIKGLTGRTIGNVVFETKITDDLNTKNAKVAEKVKDALKAANLESTYTKSVVQLNNAVLKSDFLAGKLPNSVSSLLQVKHDAEREVRFAPNRAEGEE